MTDEDEVLRTTGQSTQARVAPARGSVARKAVDIRVSHSALRKVPARTLATSRSAAAQAYSADEGKASGVPRRVAIIYRRKAVHVFTERLVSVVDETQALRERFESLPERI